MVKSLKDVLAGVKSSKVVKLDHKDMYQWNSPDGLKFIDDKHPVEKHADRVGNGDDVYQGVTKPAKYPKQKNDVYEEVEIIDEAVKSSLGNSALPYKLHAENSHGTPEKIHIGHFRTKEAAGRHAEHLDMKGKWPEGYNAVVTHKRSGKQSHYTGDGFENIDEAHVTAGSHLVNKGIASFSKRLKEMEDHELKMKKEDDKAKKKLKEENIEEGEKWIAKAIKHPGALHKKLHVPTDETIPVSKVKAAAEKGGKLGQQARLALTLRKLHKEESELEEGNKENKAKKNIIIQKLGAGEKKTARTPALRKGRESLRSMHEDIHCNMTEAGKECDVHGMKECPGYKVDSKGRNLLMDKKTNEAIEIGKALRIGNQYSDSHLAKNKRNPSSLGKPANLLDRANKTIGKLKGSTFMVKKMTEEKELNELNTKTLQDFIAAVPKDITKRAAEFNKNIGNMSVSDIKAATDKVLNRVKAQRQAAEKLEKKPIDEVAPPGLEDWIKSNKKRFVKEYGKEKGENILYAKAWKMHGKTESGLTSATNTDYAGPGAAGWTTGRLDVGTL